MNDNDLKHIIEATLLAAGRPVSTQQLIELFDERERPTAEQVKRAIELLAADYADRGIEVIEVASGWRIQVRPRVSPIVSRLWQERPSRYSRALLETLALIAYRQPITRSEIEEIRGVAVSSTIMRTLQERGWIRVVGHREVPGRPELLGTTREFLDYFGLKSLDQLPSLAELKDVETIGVQLELPAGEPPASQNGSGSADSPGSDGQATTTKTSASSEPESSREAVISSEAPAASEAQSSAESASVAGEAQQAVQEPEPSEATPASSEMAAASEAQSTAGSSTTEDESEQADEAASAQGANDPQGDEDESDVSEREPTMVAASDDERVVPIREPSV
ncbi:MAG: SMC-Scp complex subunit ScpB [Gammaproteobacteria bacterium]|nr:SMC-Scp complex subunit ScpB [Gammaproteobacteria bacterium]